MAMFGCVPVRGHYAEKGEAVVYFAGGNDLSSFFFLSFSFFPFFWGGGGGGGPRVCFIEDLVTYFGYHRSMTFSLSFRLKRGWLS